MSNDIQRAQPPVRHHHARGNVCHPGRCNGFGVPWATYPGDSFPEEPECCASGSCEVCRPGRVRWANAGVSR